MDLKNWVLLTAIFAIVGFSAYAIYTNSSQKSTSGSVEPAPTKIVADDSTQRYKDWERYSGKTIDFYYPPEWSPEEREPFGGAVIEDVELNIPNATDDNAFYSASSYDSVMPEDISGEDTIEISGREWTEWVREGEGYVSYDFFTKEKIEESAGSFGVHVTLSEEDGETKEKLKQFIESIEFKTATGAATSAGSITSEDLP